MRNLAGVLNVVVKVRNPGTDNSPQNGLTLNVDVCHSEAQYNVKASLAQTLIEKIIAGA
jgi:hypothetical protein